MWCDCLAGCVTDLDPGSSINATVFYSLAPSSLVVQYRNVPLYFFPSYTGPGRNSTYHFSVAMYKSGRVQFFYDTVRLCGSYVLQRRGV